MSKDLHHYFIRQVNQLAWASAEEGMDPFAALLVKDGAIVASSKDCCIRYSDPTAHAELVVISEYCRSAKLISLEGISLYCNTEPCVMCSGAIHWSRLSAVIFSVSQKRLQQFSGGKPKPSCEPLINIGGKKTSVMGPVLEEEGLKVFESFPFLSKKERHAKLHKK
ncbi:MAG: nucleoside deaminase [Saprospiraceae bacterium]|nr:nucleoside deaminase [Saprospiraceae bacterium]